MLLCNVFFNASSLQRILQGVSLQLQVQGVFFKSSSLQVLGIGSPIDQISTACSFPHSLAMESTSLHSPMFKLGFRRMKSPRCLKSTLISYNSSHGTSGSRSNFGDHHNNEFLEASLLLLGVVPVCP
ncbi:hypothetical protein QN277_000284 [Acacia crassicarpa]|uniref:Uncharacterized protein n=1 Tax=Acacia crassicarpa TaxID=499986 RepID=A0AAE1TFM7_9FABA|nr:hypothetical protein QN277_000284 [Acacia crassicarpa]